MAKKDLTNNEHNALVLKEINTHEEAIKKLQSKMLETEPVKYTSLAECNAMTQKNKIQRQKDEAKK